MSSQETHSNGEAPATLDRVGRRKRRIFKVALGLLLAGGLAVLLKGAVERVKEASARSE